MSWRTIASQEAFKPRGKKAELRLVNAYKAVFGQQNEDVEVVLADLANHCGFYKVAPPGASGDQLQYDAGLRAAFGRLFSFLTLPDDRLAALEAAARAENETDQSQGYI